MEFVEMPMEMIQGLMKHLVIETKSYFSIEWPFNPPPTRDKLFHCAILLTKQDRFTTCLKTCGAGSLFWRMGRGCKQTDIQD